MSASPRLHLQTRSSIDCLGNMRQRQNSKTFSVGCKVFICKANKHNGVIRTSGGMHAQGYVWGYSLQKATIILSSTVKFLKCTLRPLYRTPPLQTSLWCGERRAKQTHYTTKRKYASYRTTALYSWLLGARRIN